MRIFLLLTTLFVYSKQCWFGICPMKELDPSRFTSIFNDLQTLLSPKIFTKVEELVKNLDGVKEVEKFVSQDGLNNLVKSLKDSVFTDLLEFAENGIASKLVELKDELEKSLIGQYGQMKDTYADKIAPGFKEVEDKIAKFSFEDEINKIGKLIPEGLVKFFEKPDDTIMDFVENKVLNLDERRQAVKSVHENLVEKFTNLADDQELQSSVKNFINDNGLVKAGTKLFNAANQTFSVIEQAFNKPEAVFDKIITQIKNVAESTLLRKVMEAWQELQPYERVTGMIERVDLVNRVRNLTSEEGIIIQAKAVFGGNATEKIINLATNEKLHSDIEKLFTTTLFMDNLKKMLEQRFIEPVKKTFLNSTYVRESITILEQPDDFVKTMFNQFKGLVKKEYESTRKVRSALFDESEIVNAMGQNLDQLELIVNGVQQIINIDGFREQALVFLRNTEAVHKMIELFEKGKSIIENLLSSEKLLKNLGDLANKHLSGPLKTLGKKFQGLKDLYDSAYDSVDWMMEKKDEIMDKVDAVKEIANIATNPDLRKMMKHAKSLADNLDVVNDLTDVISNSAPLEKLKNVGDGIEKKMKSFNGDLVKKLNKLNDIKIMPTLKAAGQKIGNLVTFTSFMADNAGKATELINNRDMLTSIGKMSSDTSMLDGIMSLANNLDMAKKLSKLSDKFEKIKNMADALKNVEGLKKMADLIGNPEKIEQMAGMFIDPKLIKKGITLLTDPDIIETAIKTVIDPDLIEKGVEFLCGENIVSKAEELWDEKIVKTAKVWLDSLDPIGDAIDKFTDPQEIGKVLESMKPECVVELEEFINNSDHVQLAFTMIEYIPVLKDLPDLVKNVDVISTIYRVVTTKELPEGANVVDTVIEDTKEAVVEKIKEEMEEEDE